MAFVALDELEEDAPLRAWLFRIAHNRALDLLRSRAIRAAEPIEAALEIVDDAEADPVEMLMRRQAVQTAVSRFAELPILQRSVIILKDVLDGLFQKKMFVGHFVAHFNKVLDSHVPDCVAVGFARREKSRECLSSIRMPLE